MLNKLLLSSMVIGMVCIGGCQKNMPSVVSVSADVEFSTKAVQPTPITVASPTATGSLKKGEVRVKNGERWFRAITIPGEEE